MNAVMKLSFFRAVPFQCPACLKCRSSSLAAPVTKSSVVCAESVVCFVCPCPAGVPCLNDQSADKIADLYASLRRPYLGVAYIVFVEDRVCTESHVYAPEMKSSAANYNIFFLWEKCVNTAAVIKQSMLVVVPCDARREARVWCFVPCSTL